MEDATAATPEDVTELLRSELATGDSEDPSWVIELDDIDEPPLFSRLDQLLPLLRVPAEVRGPIVLGLALEQLQSIARQIEAKAADCRRYFACITVSSFEASRTESVPVPTVALLVDPLDAEREGALPFWRAHSRDALDVVDWLRRLGADAEHVVGELVPRPPEELRRVYVGYRPDRHERMRSVGDYWREGPPPP